MPPLWPDHENFLQATSYQKVRFCHFPAKNGKIQQCLMVFFHTDTVTYAIKIIMWDCIWYDAPSPPTSPSALKTSCKPYRLIIFRGGRVHCLWVSDTTLTYGTNSKQGSRCLADGLMGCWAVVNFNTSKCQIWVQPEMNPTTPCIGYSKWDISLSKWDMPIIASFFACNTTMAELVRCVPLSWDCDTPYSQITQAVKYSWLD